jgi:hypothetical protein
MTSVTFDSIMALCFVRGTVDNVQFNTLLFLRSKVSSSPLSASVKFAPSLSSAFPDQALTTNLVVLGHHNYNR